LEKREISDIMYAIADSSSEVLPPKGNSRSVKPAKTARNSTLNPERRTQKPERSKAAKQLDRATNPNPKSKELRGAGSSIKKNGRVARVGFGKPSKGRSAKR